MGVLTGLINGVDAVLDNLGSAVKHGIADYCDLETVDDKQTLVAKDGSLICVVEVRGVRELNSGNDVYEKITLPLCSALQGMFETDAHQMQVWFEVDPDRTREELAKAQEPAKETAKRLQMDLQDLLEEREKTLSEWTSSERCFLALWTRKTALSKSERKTEDREHAARTKDQVYTKNAQDPLRAVAMIRNRHRSFVDAVMSELSAVGVVSRQLSAREALREVRRSMDPSFTSQEWTPSLPGDRIYPTVRQHLTGAQDWEILWPPLAWQVCTREARIVEPNAVEIGDRVYAPIYIDLFPRDLQFFMQLFSRAKAKGLPWRISFLLEGGGLNNFKMKGLLASIMGFFSSGNKMLSTAIKELQAFETEMSGVNVQLRVALATWAPKNDLELLHRRTSDLARCVEGWGSCQVSETTGDPLAGVASTALALTQGSIATAAAAPMSDAIGIMPWARPTSPWAQGSILWRSPDGKIMPYEPYSKIQSTWINIFFAKPGSGKSVLMNMNHLALCLGDGLARLPRIAIIDVGPSSSGFISLIKESLPANQRHLAVHKRLRMVAEHAINPFDTQLGCRVPTPSELGFLRNFLTLLGTDFNDKRPPNGLPGLVAAVIDEMYRMRSDKNEPTRYARGLVEAVDAAVRQHNLAVDAKTSWWEVVDALFSVGEVHAAQIAQRYAMPLLPDAVTAAQSEKIRNRYGAAQVEGTSEGLISAFTRLLGDALNFFPILSRPTAFDVGDARVVALDLDEVARGGGAVGDRVTAVMYMLARQVLAKDYYLNVETVQDMPCPPNSELVRATCPVAAYKAYHVERIEDLNKDPKRICYDEFHRTSGAEAVRDQVELDMREGRKFRVDVMLASQSLKDFSPVMLELSTGVFVMDGGNELTLRDIENLFGLQNPTEKNALRTRVHPPRRGGGTFLAKFETNQGKYTMLLSATLGPIELWAFSTSAEASAIRNKLYERLGPGRARRALAAAYPEGNADADIALRKERLRESNGLLLEGQTNDVYAQIVDDVIDLAERLRL